MLFDAADRPLREVLLERYMRPTASWLLGPANSSYLLPQLANSNWECALSVWYLLDVLPELAADDPIRKQIESKVPETARWIVQQHYEQGVDLAHWEGVTWDTAVCVRSLFRVLHEFRNDFSQAQIQQFKEVIRKAIRWLAQQFQTWDTEVIYPFGPADVAQILVSVHFVHSQEPSLVREAVTGLFKDGAEMLEEIAKYLVTARDDLKDATSNDPSSVVAFWGDFFQSGEVIDCLATYVTSCRSGLLISRSTEFVDECSNHIVSCVRHMEASQVDGKWGTHSDTCRALYAYLRTTDALQGVGQEHHVVLKALRWMCDEKQTFADGSFMHTTFITVFYALALWEVYKCWSLATLPTSKVYDQALWSAPVRSTPERGLRLKLQIENQRVRERNESLEERGRTVKRVLLSASAVAAVLALGYVIATVTKVLTTSFKLGFEASDRNTFIAYAGVVVLIAIAFGGWTYRTRK